MNFVSAFNWGNNIVSYYNFNEGTGTNLDDLITHTYNGTLINNPEWVGGILGGALNFSNVTLQYVNFSTFYGFDDVNESITVNTWIYPNITEGITQYIAGKGVNWIFYQKGAKLTFAMAVTGGGYTNTWTSTNDILNKGKWQMVTVSYNGTGAEGVAMYVNGTSMPVLLDAWNDNSWVNLSGPFTIGRSPGLERYFNGGIDEFGLWNRTLSSSDIVELYNGGTGLTYPTQNVTLYSPADGLLTNLETINFTVNYSSSYYSWINGTYYLWYNNNTIYKTETVDVTGLINSTSQNFSDIPLGNYIWNVYGCYNTSETFNCIWSTANRSLIKNGKVNAIGYNIQTYHTKYEDFSIEVHIPSGSTVTSPKLIYNGTNYTATSLQNSATSYNFSKSWDVPLSFLGNMSFYWVWTIDGVNFSSNTYYQQVNETVFTFCNDTYITPFLNLTFKDEVSLSYMNASIDSSTFYYWLGSGSVWKSFTFLNTSLNYNYSFCATPNLTLHNNISIQYASTGYAQRRQIYSIDLTNTTTTKILYLLPLTDGIYSVYQVQDQNGNGLSGVTVTVERQISGVWYTLETGTTDTAGAVTFWLNPNFDHRLTFIKSGYTTLSVVIRPSSSTYSVVMSTGTEGATYNSTLADGVSWKYGIVPFATVLTQNTTYTFWFWVNSTSANLVAYKMELLNSTGGILATTTGSTSTGSNITILLNTMTNTSIRGRYSIDTGDGYVIVDADSFWPVFGYTIPPRGTISSFISNLNRINVFGEDEGRKQYSMALLFFIILFMVLGAISYSTGWDFATTGGALMLLFPIILIASLAGFFNITYLPEGAGDLASAAFIQRYTIAMITGLLAGGYIFNKIAEGRQG